MSILLQMFTTLCLVTVVEQEDPAKLEAAASKAEMSDESSSDENYYSIVEDESIYDVPPSHSHEILHISEDDIFNNAGDGPPVLPPKKKTNHGTIDERLGMVARPPEANPQRPVPVPRTSIVPKKPVPRPRTRRKSQKTSSAADPGEERRRDSESPHGDSAEGLVQYQVYFIILHIVTCMTKRYFFLHFHVLFIKLDAYFFSPILLNCDNVSIYFLNNTFCCHIQSSLKL